MQGWMKVQFKDQQLFLHQMETFNRSNSLELLKMSHQGASPPAHWGALRSPHCQALCSSICRRRTQTDCMVRPRTSQNTQTLAASATHQPNLALVS